MVMMLSERKSEITRMPLRRPMLKSDVEKEILQSRSDDRQEYWPTDTDYDRLLSTNPAGEEDTVPVVETESDGHSDSAIDRLVVLWAEIVVSHAVVRDIDDPSGYTATVAGVEGAWAFGVSEEEALYELRSVLIGWACLRLEDGDDDIPSMEGLHLVANQ